MFAMQNPIARLDTILLVAVNLMICQGLTNYRGSWERLSIFYHGLCGLGRVFRQPSLGILLRIRGLGRVFRQPRCFCATCMQACWGLVHMWILLGYTFYVYLGFSARLVNVANCDALGKRRGSPRIYRNNNSGALQRACQGLMECRELHPTSDLGLS